MLIMRGALITLEGIDGSGKSSVFTHLRERLVDYNVVFTTEPTKSWTGDAVKKSVQSDCDPLMEAFLFTADHAQHLAEVIRPAIDGGRVVISDRYADSRYAYQGATLADLFPDALIWVKNLHEGWSITPDLTILLLVDPNVAIQRCSRRIEQHKFETEGFLRRVHENYLRLADEEPERFVKIDAEQPLEDAKKQVEEKIREFIKQYFQNPS